MAESDWQLWTLTAFGSSALLTPADEAAVLPGLPAPPVLSLMAGVAGLISCRER
jgi:hypothetical protein